MSPRQLVIYVCRRLALLVTTLLGIVTIVFLMIKAIPGDEAQAAAGVTATPAQVEVVRQRLDLNARALQQRTRRTLGLSDQRGQKVQRLDVLLVATDCHALGISQRFQELRGEFVLSHLVLR